MRQAKKRKLLIGLTGGIASGKSLVAEYFHDLGVPIVDTDVIARDVVKIGSPALAEIQQLFGGDVIEIDGSLDRRALRNIVFSDENRRKQLEAILHPRIQERALSQASDINDPYAILVVPLLYESRLKDSVDRILVVDCSEETQLKRLMARDDEDREGARRIIASQSSREERLSIADDVISNDKEQAETRLQVAALHENYLSLARNICHA